MNCELFTTRLNENDSGLVSFIFALSFALHSESTSAAVLVQKKYYSRAFPSTFLPLSGVCLIHIRKSFNLIKKEKENERKTLPPPNGCELFRGENCVDCFIHPQQVSY